LVTSYCTAVKEWVRRPTKEAKMAKQDELTLHEALSDPLILALALADGWSKAGFREEMLAASDALQPALSKRKASGETRLAPSGGMAFAPAGCCA
jgi:hypothetical protein